MVQLVQAPEVVVVLPLLLELVDLQVVGPRLEVDLVEEGLLVVVVQGISWLATMRKSD